MSLKNSFHKWLQETIEEGAAETVAEIAIDQFPPVVVLSFVSYGCLFLSAILALTGWHFETLHVLSYVVSAITGSCGVLLYLVRMYVVSKLSKLVLQGYYQVKAKVRAPTEAEAPK